jgi:hypothetical protein
MSIGPSTVTPADVGNAERLGRFAARRRLAVTTCPYRPAEDARQSALAAAWMRAYLHYNPPMGTVSYADAD